MYCVKGFYLTTLIIGCDEFLGSEVTRQLLMAGETVVGLSIQAFEMSPLHEHRLKQITSLSNAKHFKYMGNLGQLAELENVQLKEVRQIFYLPDFDTELVEQEFALLLALRMLSFSEQIRPRHLVFSSSYKVYCPDKKPLASRHSLTSHPQNLTAGIVKAIESLLHGFCASKRVPCTVLRLFELYGNEAASDNLVQNLLNHATQKSQINLADLNNDIFDFVYVEDAAKIVIRAMEHAARSDTLWHLTNASLNTSNAPWHVYDVGSGIGMSHADILALIEKALNHNIPTFNNWSTEQMRWVADPTELKTHMGLKAKTTAQQGIQKLLKQWKP